MPAQPLPTTLYHLLYLLRRFDETVLENFSKGVFFGTTHTYLGQEANAVGVLAHLQEGDVVFSNHRCHGHFLAYGGDPRALFAELMGRATGVCGGRGGSQHLQWKNFYSNGVQGGIVPNAVGMALAEKYKALRCDAPASPGRLPVAIVFIGDGTLGEGAVYEALNLASLWQAPVLFVVENNRIAQTTPIELAVAGDMALRFAAFGIPVEELDSSDVLEILPLAGRLIDDVRSQCAPRALILHTCRFGPHSKGDDTRPAEQTAGLRQQRDPLAILSAHLSPAERQAIEIAVDKVIELAYKRALEDAFPELSEQDTVNSIQLGEEQPLYTVNCILKTVLDSLNHALHQAMTNDPRVLLLGEDLLDPYGGAFKVSRGLSSAFPERVLTTPISEAGFTGAAAGMALRGLRPVAEIMFGDFVTLIADQVTNHAAKFRWMYNGNKTPGEQVNVPLVIRAPMGGRRGYGPTHSQTLEKHFLGVPGLRVLAPNNLSDPGALLYETILTTRDPVLFVENKLLYLLPLHTSESLAEFDVTLYAARYMAGGDETFHSAQGDAWAGRAPTTTLRLRGAPQPTLTLTAYGYMAELARQAMLKLAYEYEIFAELVVPTQLAPFVLDEILESAERTRRLITVEEGTLSLGWGAEALAQAAQALGGRLLAARRIAALDLPVPASGGLEAAVLPGVEEMVRVCLNVDKKG